ncbi:hypothetical protein BB561_000943 [Smittium simulii]|uniref:Prefoldin, alpha subunit n=1 Tax=Smittium simulii TaxID=133385 RepID=A0A2T9YWY7_9FUNG|nr:hypothetical protein BB561_000943 [Smittium simulii]
MSATELPASNQQQIRIEDLSLPQLSSLRDQFNSDIAKLTQLYSQLRNAISTFSECNNCVEAIASKSLNKVLVPLTNSLYVRGELVQPDNLIVDVGTGYYLEKNCSQAQKFYSNKIEYLSQNADKLAKTIEEKQTNLQVLADILATKAAALQKSQPASEASSKA